MSAKIEIDFMKFIGLKRAFIFFVLSILITLTFVGPIYIPMFAEAIGNLIDSAFNIGNTSGTTFYFSVAICSSSFLYYVFCLIRNINKSLIALTIFFCSIFIFFNAALFYFEIRFRDSHVDGQQIFDSIDKPIKTCLLYLLFGILHDFIIYRIRKQKHIGGFVEKEPES